MITEIRVRKNNHTFIQIDCDDRGTLIELSEYFTFFVPNYQHMPAYKNRIWDGKIRLFNNRTQELYAGLYNHLLEFAGAEGRGYRVVAEDSSEFGSPMLESSGCSLAQCPDLKLPVTPRDYQIDAANHALDKKRALLVSPTASGKSLIIYTLIQWFLENRNSRALILVPTTSLVQQMLGDFEDYSSSDSGFDAEGECWTIYSGKDKNPPERARVVISTWQSIYKMPKEYFDQFGCVIGDEAHNFKAKSLTSILTKMTEAEFRFGTTGTLDDTLTHRLVLEGLFGPAKYVTTTRELMDQGNLAALDIRVLVAKYPDSVCKEINKSKYQQEIDFIIGYEPRNRLISNLALDLDGNTLILFQYVDKHGKVLDAMIRDRAAKDRKVFFVSGKTDVDTREEVRRITEIQANAIIVASVGVFSTGVNIRNIHNIIFASPSKSQIRVLQSIGRGLRKADDGRDTRLFDIADDLHWGKNKNYALKHSGERIRIYSKEKFKYNIHEVEMK